MDPFKRYVHNSGLGGIYNSFGTSSYITSKDRTPRDQYNKTNNQVVEHNNNVVDGVGVYGMISPRKRKKVSTKPALVKRQRVDKKKKRIKPVSVNKRKRDKKKKKGTNVKKKSSRIPDRF